MFDGDTVFTMATGDRAEPDEYGLFFMMAAAADCFTRAVGHAMLAAETTHTRAGSWRSYRDAFPTAFAQVPEQDGGQS